jgi:hypothetical protein
MPGELKLDAEFEKLLGAPLSSGGARTAFNVPSNFDVVVKKVHVGFVGANVIWPAPGSEDTELGVLMEPEVDHGETEVYAGVQA